MASHHTGRTKATSTKRRVKRDRIALATWSRANDAKVGCTLRLEWDRVSLAHPGVVPVAVLGYALGQALKQNPIANRRIVLWGLRPHKTVRISFAVDAKDDLKVAVVDRVDELDARQLQQALKRAALDARKGIGPLARATRLVEHLPVVIGRPALRLWSFITAGLGIGMLGVPGAPFGAAILSSVGRFGLPAVDVPFIPFTRCVLVCSIGSVTPTVIARDGIGVVVETVDVAVTVDHRVSDASQFAALLATFESACYGTY